VRLQQSPRGRHSVFRHRVTLPSFIERYGTKVIAELMIGGWFKATHAERTGRIEERARSTPRNPRKGVTNGRIRAAGNLEIIAGIVAKELPDEPENAGVLSR
jgi:hypothetical protein